MLQQQPQPRQGLGSSGAAHQDLEPAEDGQQGHGLRLHAVAVLVVRQVGQGAAATAGQLLGGQPVLDRGECMLEVLVTRQGSPVGNRHYPMGKTIIHQQVW